MKLSRNAEIVMEKGGYILCLNDDRRRINPEDVYILDAVRKGRTNEGELVKMVIRREGLCELMAELRLAQIVLDYGDFLAPEESGPIEA